MKIEEWRQIERIYHAALERPAEERSEFLDAVCAGDQGLRREVESLLAHDEQAMEFIETPPGDIAAGMIAEERSQSLDGRTLGHYRMITILGAGGMGEVYLAQDTQLGRKAALKLLPSQFTQDADRLRRFVSEARAASALNHPNIITIYEIGEIDGTHYIATEFVEGVTLRQKMSSERLELRGTLDAAIQIASALDAAHKAGIVHRDIKPENIMMRPDGLIKVLDFGLAKLTEAQTNTVDARATTVGGNSTGDGMVMGTPRYMSPEQARGQKVDARTDIFSLGVVLYEMIAGCAPFEGETPSDIIASILKTSPPPLAAHWPDAPHDLEQIVEKMLRKDRDRRYQVIKDLQIDLKDLKDRLDFEARLGGAQYREPSGVAAPGATGTDRTHAAALAGDRARPLSGAITRPGALLAMGVLAAAALGFLFYRSTIRPEHFQTISMIPLTTAGRAAGVAISPDSRLVVYTEDEDGQQSLRLRQVDTGSDNAIVSPAAVEYRGAAFSRDGNYVYYVRMEQPGAPGVLYRAPALGGPGIKLVRHVDSPIALSPDGRLSFVRNNPRSGESALMVADDHGAGEEKALSMRMSPEVFSSSGPSWSPDGKVIACGYGSGGPYQTVVGVRVADGGIAPITSQRWERVYQVAWLADGSGLVLVAAEQPGSSSQLWHLSYPDGKARRITNDLSNYENISLSADSATLAAVRGERVINIWIMPAKDAGSARQITTGARREDGLRGLAWTPDGRIVYRSLAGGNANVWIMGADGAGNRQLSADSHQSLDPAISHDGRHIVWSASLSGPGNRNIWRMELDGSKPVRLTNGGGEWYPQCTSDGKWLIYQAIGPGPNDRQIWKMSLDTGGPIQLTDKPSYAPVISPDGKWIVCNYREEAGAPIRAAVVSIDGGKPARFFDLPVEYDRDRPLRWTVDGRALSYIVTGAGVSNIWAQPLDDGPARQLTGFREHRIFNFAWSRDGKHLALSRLGVASNDIVLIRNAR